MKTFLTLAFALFILNLNAQKISLNDSTEITDIINDWNNAWNLKDYKLASNGYSDDAKFTNAFGDHKKGRLEIEQLLKEVFSLSFVMSGQSMTKEQFFQILTEDIIVVHTLVERTGQKLPDNTFLPTRRTTHLRVFKKVNSKWSIKAHLISDAKDKEVYNK